MKIFLNNQAIGNMLKNDYLCHNKNYQKNKKK